ncbi:hypothetical protein JGS6364_22161 [[Clostridium] sordellii]|uniref:Uncharacterized protein n=1 Tax=Paraclostridium sordellii TaxID=1505 RepID=A0A0A1SFQ2_PARSO|nr:MULTISPECIES: hypothetical protein [Paeniclostridium]EPZ53878.1 hypothetical protein H477_4717 [[Clostridium] sordellii ATCC 9714] [Paeniclostridium sordellii ATCC 9714]MDU5020290.1 hypothetical protein [Clostridiales bacterium]AUN13028.1 hypothetical protein RSJ16_01830 [Paeniclostridium sordellii]EPZ55159.1 hypothetical protein H476_3077 [[Clostridium] sordellii VPI 9048] [Paeniclostridium sordellii VPI 9048]MBS6022989.1 hypothetical protein [Paeniclostridium sordellii]
MGLNLGKSIAVSTSYVKSNPAVPVYKGEESPENLYAVIYHIEIGYNEKSLEKAMQYIIIDYKEFELCKESKDELVNIAKEYCKQNGINDDEQTQIELLDNEEAENFLEKVFNNMKVIRGLITQRD